MASTHYFPVRSGCEYATTFNSSPYISHFVGSHEAEDILGREKIGRTRSSSAPELPSDLLIFLNDDRSQSITSMHLKKYLRNKALRKLDIQYRKQADQK